MKVILRFCYSLSSNKDANQTQAVQLDRIFKDNALVISVVQAGFIGIYGEWDDTKNMKNEADRKAIINALLEVVPLEIMIQVRTPKFKQEWCGRNLAAQTAHVRAACARIGMHNDCFLAKNNDKGTFRSDQVTADQDYFASNSLSTPAGGETCEVNPPRTDCNGTQAEIAKYHYTLLNKDWHEKVVSNWNKSNCYTSIKSMLGYRYQLNSIRIPTNIARGQKLTFTFTVKDTGVAPLYNYHPAEIILRNASTVRKFAQGELDARRWAAGSSYPLAVNFTVPKDLPIGSYEVLLHIYDPKQPNNQYNRIVVINSGMATDERYNKLNIIKVA